MASPLDKLDAALGVPVHKLTLAAALSSSAAFVAVRVIIFNSHLPAPRSVSHNHLCHLPQCRRHLPRAQSLALSATCAVLGVGAIVQARGQWVSAPARTLATERREEALLSESTDVLFAPAALRFARGPHQHNDARTRRTSTHSLTHHPLLLLAIITSPLPQR